MQHSCVIVKKSPSQVASHFWELASTNTKQIFDVVPGDFLPQFKNPCFWETYTPRRDPYAGSPYAPKVGETYKYDPWGHTGYYKRARDRFPGHLQHNKTTNQYKRIVIPCDTSATNSKKRSYDDHELEDFAACHISIWFQRQKAVRQPCGTSWISIPKWTCALASRKMHGGILCEMA